MKSYSLLYVFLVITTFLAYCTKKDQVVSSSSGSSSTLNAYKTSTAPLIDATQSQAIWNNATALAVTPTVPDPGNGLFMGYWGEQYPATIQAMYDNTFLYLKVQWADSTNVLEPQPWVFDPVAHSWSQRSNSKLFDANGNLTKRSMGLDQLAFQWNIDNSTQNFATQTCYASCHVFSPYRNYAGVYNANLDGNHYTNGANEKVDLWWAKLNKDISLTNQMDDWYIDDAGGPSATDSVGGNGNGRHADGQVKPSPFSTTYILPATKKAAASNYSGPYSNSQTLSYTLASGTKVSVKVPLYIEIGSTKPYYPSTDIGGAAVKVTGVDSMGVLTLANSQTLDPNADAASYADDPGIGRNVGAKCFPGFISQPYIIGSERDDINGSAYYDGTKWTVIIKRKLKTSDVLKQDADFTDLTDRPFGMAIWNTANNQHGIQPNLLLHFQQ